MAVCMGRTAVELPHALEKQMRYLIGLLQGVDDIVLHCVPGIRPKHGHQVECDATEKCSYIDYLRSS
jgi:hypothetical protein